MAVVSFDKTTRTGIYGARFEKSVSLSSATTSDIILIPDGVRGINCTIAFGGTATAKVQYTNSTLAEIDAGTAVWIDGAAAGSSNSAQYLNPCNAIRLNVTAWTSSTVVLSAVAQ